jgi:hypothetical protein
MQLRDALGEHREAHRVELFRTHARLRGGRRHKHGDEESEREPCERVRRPHAGSGGGAIPAITPDCTYRARGGAMLVSKVTHASASVAP